MTEGEFDYRKHREEISQLKTIRERDYGIIFDGEYNSLVKLSEELDLKYAEHFLAKAKKLASEIAKGSSDYETALRICLHKVDSYSRDQEAYKYSLRPLTNIKTKSPAFDSVMREAEKIAEEHGYNMGDLA